MDIIKKISSSETFLVRQPVLRAGKTLESYRFGGDDLKITHHFGIYLGQELAGIISLFQKNDPGFTDPNQFQIRGMAVLQNQQKKDFGKSLILHSEEFCKNHNVDLIWFNARVEAVGFYEKMGCLKTGFLFEIPNEGEPVVMFKKI